MPRGPAGRVSTHTQSHHGRVVGPGGAVVRSVRAVGALGAGAVQAVAGPAPVPGVRARRRGAVPGVPRGRARAARAHGALHREHGFAEECDQLALVCAEATPAACAASPLVARMQKHTFCVKLGRTAEMLLLTFLEEEGMREILYIIQTHIETNPTYTHPVSLARANAEAHAHAADGTGTHPGKRGSPGRHPDNNLPKRRKPTARAASGKSLTGGDDRCNRVEIKGGPPKREEEVDRARSISDNAAKTAANSEYSDKAKKLRADALKIDRQRAEKRARRPPWIGRAGPVPSLAEHHSEWYRDMVEKLMVRIKPRQEHAEAEDARKCVKLGYPSDHRKSKVAWYADNGLEIDAPSELNNVRTKGFGKGRSDLKSRERNLGKIEEEERSKRIAADRARAVHEDANGPVLPSVLSVSLKNNYGAVACSAVSRDGVQVAAGYSDSNVVRVWRLDGGKHLGYTYGFSSSSSAGGVGAAGAPRRLRLLRLRRRLAPTISARRTVLSPRAHTR